MTLSDRQGHAPVASVFNCDFSYICAAVDKISIDIARRAVSPPADLFVLFYWLLPSYPALMRRSFIYLFVYLFI